MKNKFYNIISKIGIRNAILIMFIFITLAITALYQTFSLYTESGGLSIIDGIETYSFILSNSNTTNSVIIAPGNRKHIDITVSNGSSTDLKYNLYYSSNNDLSDVFIAHPHDTVNRPTGTIPSSTNYVVTIEVYNYSDSNITINFGLKYGFENAGDLPLEDGQYSIEGYTMMKQLFDEDIDFSDVNDAYYLSDAYYEYIKNASFVNYIDTSNAILNENSEKVAWDFSLYGDGSVIGWLQASATEGYYDLYIGANEKIYTESLAYFFNYLITLENISFNNLDTSLTTDMSHMFYRCSNLTSLDVSNFDTSNVTNMSGMFVNCSILIDLDLSNFNTLKVTNMASMFNGCSSLTVLDLSSFDTSNVTDMYNLFSLCSNLTGLDLSSFDTSNVTNMQNLFAYCSSLTTTITIMSTSTTSYNRMFDGAATATGATITVNYTEETSALVDSMLATKSSNSNVVKATNPTIITS